MSIIAESQESSSPMITRAVAAGLLGREFTAYQFSAIERAALAMLGVLPQRCSQWLIPRVQGRSALNPKDVANVRISSFITSRVNDYAALDRMMPAVVLGVGMGGATAHLSLALEAPFLPQAFVMTLKGGSSDGDVIKYFERSKNLASHITDSNPGVMTIQHFDPIHDGWLVRRVNHLRLKLIHMPEEYKKFILTHIKPGGDVVYLEGGAKWLRYQFGERNVFQVGGWGDISAKEFLEGSDRIRKYCELEGIKHSDWRLTGYPLIEGPESEWGSEPGLGEEIESYCHKEGYRFTRIRFEDPNDFAQLAFLTVREQFRQNGIDPTGTIVETFSQYDPAAVSRYGLLPLWLIFNTEDSLRFLSDFCAEFDHNKPVLMSSLSTFSLTPDMASWNQWQESLDSFTVKNIGARKSHYPADPLALICWQEWLRKAVDDRRIGPLQSISAKKVSEIASGIE